MMVKDKEDRGDDLRELIALDSLCCYAMRELAALHTRCDKAEDAIAAAQAALRARIESVEANCDSDIVKNSKILIH